MKKVTLQLDGKLEKGFERAWGLTPLSEIVENALRVLNPNCHRYFSPAHLAKIALRAVAEAVVREGCLPSPLRLEVGFAGIQDGYATSAEVKAGVQKGFSGALHKRMEATKSAGAAGDQYEELTVTVPKVFAKLAEYYHQDPEYLSSVLIEDFCMDPPRLLTIVERASPCCGG